MARNRQMRSSFKNVVTQEQLKENMLNLEKTMKEDNMLLVEGLVMLQGKVNAVNSRVEERFSHVEEKIKHFSERTNSLYLQFRREHFGQGAIDHEPSRPTSPILHADAQNTFEQSVVHNQVGGNNNRTMFDKYGLIPLTEEQILKLKKGTSCVLFIGRLLQASFPDGYFYNHMDNITQVQLDRLYEIISSHYTVIKRAKREAVKLSFTEALPVIKNAAYNLRYRTKIIEIMQSKDVESCDSDDDCCDEQCVPPHHLPTCKMSTERDNFPVSNENGRVVSKEKDGRKIQNSVNHTKVTVRRTRKRGGKKLSTGKFKCNICGKSYCSKRSRDFHQLVHSDPQNWNHCTLCHYKTPYMFRLSRHMGTIHKNK